MTRSAFRIEKVDSTAPAVWGSILEMHKECFPGLYFNHPHGDWWIAYDRTRSPAAFAGLWASVTMPGAGYLCRAGVLPSGRGQGLQRRLIRVREREARKKGMVALLSDVDPVNAHSMNNLFSCGFTAFRPSKPWGGHEWVYVKKIIDEGVG